MSEEQQQNEVEVVADSIEQQVRENEAATSSTLHGREILLTPPINELLKKQSVAVEGEENVRRSPRVKDGEYLATMFDDVFTVHEMFIHGYNMDKTRNCLGKRPKEGGPYSWITYQEVFDRVHRAGSGLIAKGAETNTTQFVGIYSQNNPEWVIMDRACAAYSIVTVPLYDTLGADAMTHIVKQCELKIIMVDTNVKAKKILEDAKCGNTSTLRLLVMVETPDDDTKSLCNETNIEAITEKELEELGSKDLKDFVPPKPHDLYTVCYTSGTTGVPKGVMHTHVMAVSLVSAFLVSWLDYNRHIQPSDVHISYLPLAHVFERYVLVGTMMHGAMIGFFRGDPKLLMDDAATLKPTIFLLVPRLINRLYGKIMAAVGQSGLKRSIFNFCLNRKMSALKKGEVSNDTIWDKILFHKFQAVLGGRVQLSITGAAPISPVVLNVVRCVMGIPIVEVYGQTECTGAVTTTLSNDFEGGNVGSILPNCELKLVDVPEKEYYAKDNKGEICCRGLTIFKEYFKNEEKTKETIDSDGWLHTGDIGEWLPNGTLKIIDRRKNIFKLSQGEYISPEKVEQVYTMSDPVQQVFVHGESLKSCVVSIVVAEEETLAQWCKGKGVEVGEKSFTDLCGMEKVADLILEDMNKVGRHNGLKSFELAKKVHVITEAFTVQNDMLTPSLKSRRIQIEKKYRADIDRMYAGLD